MRIVAILLLGMALAGCAEHSKANRTTTYTEHYKGDVVKMRGPKVVQADPDRNVRTQLRNDPTQGGE